MRWDANVGSRRVKHALSMCGRVSCGCLDRLKHDRRKAAGTFTMSVSSASALATHLKALRRISGDVFCKQIV